MRVATSRGVEPDTTAAATTDKTSYCYNYNYLTCDPQVPRARSMSPSKRTLLNMHYCPRGWRDQRLPRVYCTQRFYGLFFLVANAADASII
uniref:Uncharacterized protein n=1 Tax=Trichogramma kaykai TaxID=54128 RepID=A0ABD2W2S2_9HYME